MEQGHSKQRAGDKKKQQTATIHVCDLSSPFCSMYLIWLRLERDAIKINAQKTPTIGGRFFFLLFCVNCSLHGVLVNLAA